MEKRGCVPCPHPDTDLTGPMGQRISNGAGTQKQAEERAKSKIIP